MKTRNVRIRRAKRYMRHHVHRFGEGATFVYPASISAAVYSLNWAASDFRKRYRP